MVNQIAAGEVVERPASVVKELIENSLDAGADQLVIEVIDGGRTLINIVDNGGGMSREDLANCIKRHATSKLPSDDLLNINFMGFRGEALPSIASVSKMTIDTFGADGGLQMNCDTGEIKPSAWESGTRMRVEGLFGKTPARLKFLRGDRSEMISVTDVVKRLAMARPDVGFTLNQNWRFPRGQSLIERVVSVMGDEVEGRMLAIDSGSGNIRLHGFISEPTLRRASSMDQYLFVNGRPVKDKVLVGALRAAYMDVMSAREFPLCALYLEMPSNEVDVNVSPAKTDVHFLEPARIRGFMISAIRAAIAKPMTQHRPKTEPTPYVWQKEYSKNTLAGTADSFPDLFLQPTVTETFDQPLGRVVGQIGNKYIIADTGTGIAVVDQHAAHERLVYENLRDKKIKSQPLLSPTLVKMKPDLVVMIIELKEELSLCGLILSEFGEDTIAIYEKPADWDLDWAMMLKSVAEEATGNDHSSALSERLHLKLANFACHHSVRAGQRLDYAQMDALLRDIEGTERAGQCNHGRPVYKIIKIEELDKMFERV